MRKILLPVGQQFPNTATLDFAGYIARLTKSGLTGIFLEHEGPDEALLLDQINIQEPVDATSLTAVRPAAIKSLGSEQLIQLFEEACTSQEVVSHIHQDQGTPWHELMTECRYADLMIVDPSYYIHEDDGLSPTHDVKKLLHEAECPVIVAPPSFEDVEELIFTFDGTKSSVNAIRQFIHLFPEFAQKRVVVLGIVNVHTDIILQRNRLMEWLGEYYQNLEFSVLEGDPENRLLEYLLLRPNTLVVMGGYGRGHLSRILQPSKSASVIRYLAAPVFIAHY